jgi:acyl carrier protein
MSTPPDHDARSLLQARLRKVLLDALQLDELPAGNDVRRNDVQAWDSVSHLRLVLEVEQEFGVTLDDEKFVSVDSIGAMADLLLAQGVKG